MKFRPTTLKDVIIIEPDLHHDDRGSFAETYRKSLFAENGIKEDFIQDNFSFSGKGTLRGLHYQLAPHAESKLIRCTRGRVFDVAVDVRADSATRGKWCAAELSADDGRMMFIPGGFAHGFETLEEASEVFYQMSAAYAPEMARGVRWDDPGLAIDWPVADPIVSERDGTHPFLLQFVT